MIYDPRDWFWQVAGDATRLYGSAANAWHPADDPAVTAWTAAGGRPTSIASEAELADVLRAQAPGLIPAWLLAAPSFIRPAPGQYTADQLAAYAAHVRWRHETGGITVAGLPVATDDRSKLMIAGARIKADQDPDFVTLWNGVTPITSVEIVAISDAVLAHVDLCFRTQGQVLAAITAGTVTTLAEIDSEFAAM